MLFQNDRKEHSGFSLVELSIVLVILGLLTGGVLTGQSLIKAAELRSVTIELNQYQTAVNTFKGKYFGLPGDMPNATQFWGDNTSVCDDGDASNDGDPGTCNGNGNGALEDEASAAGQEIDSFLFWQHLGMAGLISGQYSGIAGPGDDDEALPEINVPTSAYNNACYSFALDPSGSTTQFAVSYGTNVLELGKVQAGDDCDDPIFPAEDLWNIDTKIDDGKPAQGKLIAKYWSDCTSAILNTITDSVYSLSDSTVQCSLMLRNWIN